MYLSVFVLLFDRRNILYMVFLVGTFFQPACIEDPVWLDCTNERIFGIEEVQEAQDEVDSPYFGGKVPICLASPPNNSVRTVDGLRFNWRDEDVIRFFKVVLSDEPLVKESDRTEIRNVDAIIAVWDESIPGNAGFLRLDSLQAAENGEPSGEAVEFENGVRYYWSVWGFDRLGRLSHASEERSFVLDEIANTLDDERLYSWPHLSSLEDSGSGDGETYDHH